MAAATDQEVLAAVDALTQALNEVQTAKQLLQVARQTLADQNNAVQVAIQSVQSKDVLVNQAEQDLRQVIRSRV